MSDIGALLTWINSFSEECNFPSQTVATITNGVALSKISALLMSSALFPDDEIGADTSDEDDEDGKHKGGGDALLHERTISRYFAALAVYAKSHLSFGETTFSSYVDFAAVARGDAGQVAKALEIVLTCCVLSGGQTVKKIRTLPTAEQSTLHGAVKHTIPVIGVSKRKVDDVAGAASSHSGVGASSSSVVTNATDGGIGGGASPTPASSSSSKQPQVGGGFLSSTAARITEEELRAARHRIDELVNSNSSLNDKVATLTEQLQQATAENFRMRDKYKEAVSQSTSTSAIETKELKNELAKKDREFQEASDDLERTRKLLQESRNDHSNLQGEHDKLKRHNTTLEEQIAKVKSESSSSGTELRNALDDLELQKKKSADLEGKALDALERLRVAEEEVALANKTSAASVNKAAALEKTMEQLRAAVATAQQDKQAAEDKLASTTEVLENAKRSAVGEQSAQIELLTDQLVEAREEVDQLMKAMKAEQEEKEAAVAEAARLAAASQQRQQQDADDVDQKNKKQSETLVAEYQQRIDQLNADHAAATASFASEKQNLEKINSELTEALRLGEAQLTQLKTDQQAAKEELSLDQAAMEQDVADLQDDLKRALAENEALKQRQQELLDNAADAASKTTSHEAPAATDAAATPTAAPAAPAAASAAAATSTISPAQLTALQDENAQLRRQFVSAVDEMKKQHAIVVSSLFECGQRNLQLQTQLVAAKGGMVPGGGGRYHDKPGDTTQQQESISFFERQRRKFAPNALEAIAMASQPK